MSQDQVWINYQRGGRRFSQRSFTVRETQNTPFGQVLEEQGLTVGLGNDFEVYVTSQDGDQISAHNRESTTLESVLTAAAENGEIAGKSFTIDCTVAQRGAILLGIAR